MASAYGRNMKSWLVFVIILLLVCNLGAGVDGEPQVPCYFIFGDSLSDSGNNNLLVTLAKANFRPYGIDFPKGATGRFTNGRTLVDVIAELLGFGDYIPSFAKIGNGRDVLQGVNYASGAAGIRNDSGQHLGDRFTMNEQLGNHRVTVTQIAALLGGDAAAADHLRKCLFTVGIGSNDYISNYFLPSLYPTSRQYTPEQYAAALIAEYSSQLKTLHQLGARKVALFGLGLVGCAPAELAAYGPSPGSTCVDHLNSAVQLFNNGIKSLVDDLNNQFTDAKFTYIDYYGIGLRDVQTAGFKVTDSGCCGGRSACTPLATPCPNRKEYTFWDDFHPSEAANVIFAARAYKSATPSDASPIDISTLAKL